MVSINKERVPQSHRSLHRRGLLGSPPHCPAASSRNMDVFVHMEGVDRNGLTASISAWVKMYRRRNQRMGMRPTMATGYIIPAGESFNPHSRDTRTTYRGEWGGGGRALPLTLLVYS